MPHVDESTRLILIPAGKTDWADQRRVQGDMDLPLNEEGITQAQQWSSELAGSGISVLYCGTTGPTRETAERIGKALKLKPKHDEELDEVNLGLWQGMRVEEIQQKHPSVFKLWMHHPEQVEPPSGESLGTGRDRVERAIERIVQKNRPKSVGIVLGRISFALVIAHREGGQPGRVWEILKQSFGWKELPLDLMQ